jgi:hypothetical protein
MKKIALKVFRQPPEHLNCAQTVLYAWNEVSGDRRISLTELKPFGGGRASGGMCGALHAACLIAPDRAGDLQAAFAARLYCKELRTAKVHPCETCVVQATELLELHSAQIRSEP